MRNHSKPGTRVLLGLSLIKPRDNLAQQALAPLFHAGLCPALQVLVAGLALFAEARQRLAGPLVEERVDGRLEPGGDAARCTEEDKGVVGPDQGRPAARVLVGVGRRRVGLGPAGRVHGLVKDGQLVRLQVDRLETDVGVRGSHTSGSR